MKKQLSELTDRELEKAADRTWRKHHALVKEQNRRNRIERYGTAEPDLKAYNVSVSLDSIEVTVEAESEKDAEDIVLDGLWVNTGDQIEINDWSGFDIYHIEEAELGEDAAAHRDENQRALEAFEMARQQNHEMLKQKLSGVVDEQDTRDFHTIH